MQNFFLSISLSNHERFSHYGSFPETERLAMLEEARKMFVFGYDCYMKCAFPADELDPVRCKGKKDGSNLTFDLFITELLVSYFIGSYHGKCVSKYPCR